MQSSLVSHLEEFLQRQEIDLKYCKGPGCVREEIYSGNSAAGFSLPQNIEIGFQKNLSKVAFFQVWSNIKIYERSSENPIWNTRIAATRLCLTMWWQCSMGAWWALWTLSWTHAGSVKVSWACRIQDVQKLNISIEGGAEFLSATAVLGSMEEGETY